MTNIGRGDAEIYSFPSVIELLGNSNITSKYYTGSPNSAEGIWNPLPGFQQYAKGFDVVSHLATTRKFYDDIANGTLPQVCWLVPGKKNSEHPPKNVQDGMWYVTDLVNAVMQSKYWQNCAIVIMWDDYGGFYDHVRPIQTDELGFGFRVPALIISPYSRSGHSCALGRKAAEPWGEPAAPLIFRRNRKQETGRGAVGVKFAFSIHNFPFCRARA